MHGIKLKKWKLSGMKTTFIWKESLSKEYKKSEHLVKEHLDVGG